MDIAGPASAPASSETASPVPVRVHYAVRQGDVVGITLAAVGTLIFIFSAILVFHFYRHKKLELREDEQKRQVRTPEAELGLGPDCATDRSVLKVGEAARASAPGHAHVKVALPLTDTTARIRIRSPPIPEDDQATYSSSSTTPDAAVAAAPASSRASGSPRSSSTSESSDRGASPRSGGPHATAAAAPAAARAFDAATDPSDSGSDGPGIESISSIALLPPPPTSHTTSPSTTAHATLMSTIRSSTSQGTRKSTPAAATSPRGSLTSSPKTDPAAMSTVRSGTPSPPPSPLSVAPATIMSTIREAQKRSPSSPGAHPSPPPPQHHPASPGTDALATVLSTMHSPSQTLSATATGSSSSIYTSEDLTGSYTGSTMSSSSPSRTPRSTPASSLASAPPALETHGTLSSASTAARRGYAHDRGTPSSPPSASASATSMSGSASRSGGPPASGGDSASEGSASEGGGPVAADAGFMAVMDDTGMDALTPPPLVPEPTSEELQEEMLFLQYQLDCFSHDQEFLPGLILLGPGPRTRFYGEQAIVQLAHNALSGREVAVKVFATRTTFNAEAALLTNTASPLRSFMPALLALHDNAGAALQGAAGAPLPPCIVMEKGEPLDVFCHLRNPSRNMTFMIILQISTVLRDVHDTGYVHRDFKPSNILWVDAKQRWLMVGFDQAAAADGAAPLSTSTLAYTAPEVLAATCDGDSAMHVSPVIDAWSLGVVVLELLLAEPAFPPSATREEVVSQILGEEGCLLPWEDPHATVALRSRLGALRPLVLALLARDPAQRLPVHVFVDACQALAERSRRGRQQRGA